MQPANYALRRLKLCASFLLITVSAATAQSEGVYRIFSLVDEHAAMMLLIDPETGKILAANKSAKDFYGYRALIGMSIQDINVLSSDEVAAERRRAALGVRNYFLFPHRLADGSIRVVEVYSSPVTQPGTGRPLLLSILHDATGKDLSEADLGEYLERLKRLVDDSANRLAVFRAVLVTLAIVALGLGVVGFALALALRAKRKAEAAMRETIQLRSSLYKELQHRVKNSLALMSSMMGIEAGRAVGDEARERIEALIGRVDTLARLYERMFMDGEGDSLDCAAYIRAVAEGIEQSYGQAGDDIAFSYELSPLELDSKRASALGVIANEFVTNAFKYGGRDGTIAVKLVRLGGWVSLSVVNGGELPAGFDPPSSRGFGLVIASELARQLGGDLGCRSAGGLVEFVVRFPEP